MNRLPDYIRRLGSDIPEARLERFARWCVDHLWSEYLESRMKLATLAANHIATPPLLVPNGTKGEPFPENAITLPAELTFDYQFAGLEGIGLNVEKIDDHTFRIVGKPCADGDFEVGISYDYEGREPDEPRGEHHFHLIINPDPRSLWKDIPTPTVLAFYKPDSATQYIKRTGFDVVAASMRGRSHANEGKPRDDHFGIAQIEDTGWYILSVCDGAGSAQYSREGARVACDTVVRVCEEHLSADAPGMLEDAVAAYVAVSPDQKEEKTKCAREVYDRIYGILGQAALKAHKEIANVAAGNNFAMRDFSTTLLLTICKKFDFGWFVASYWVGDGAIGIYDAPTRSVKIMGTPDEGEFSGQTRFLTMPEVFRTPQDIYNRLRFAVVPDFTAVVLMSDGVSDPMFETDERLNDPAQWKAFWDRLTNGFPDDDIPGVNLHDNDPDCAEQLLRWLNFWSKGNHDDRTLVILY